MSDEVEVLSVMVFFFKQKTAYEVRISDWSSDLCSSDLIDAMRRTFPEADIYPMYGLTEAFRSTYLDPALVADHPNSMGRAIPYAEILVCRPDGSVASADKPGEIARQSVGKGKGGYVRVDLGGRGLVKKKNKKQR